MGNTEVWVGLISAISGGLGLKVFDFWVSRAQAKVDEATRIRDDLRGQISEQNNEIKELEKSLDDWKDKFYQLKEDYATVNAQYVMALNQLKLEMEEEDGKTDDV